MKLLRLVKIRFILKKNFFVVEKYEYTNDGIDVYSVNDGYKSIELAIKMAKTL